MGEGQCHAFHIKNHLKELTINPKIPTQQGGSPTPSIVKRGSTVTQTRAHTVVI